MSHEAQEGQGSQLVLPQASSAERLFAWNGLAFLLPADWELSYCDLQGGVSSVAHEDGYERRMDAAWFLPKDAVAQEREQENFQKKARALSEKATAIRPIAGIDEAWTAHEYHLEDTVAVLVMAYRLPQQAGEPMALFHLHFPAGSRELPTLVTRSLARSFRSYSVGEAPWAFYDVYFTLRRDFRLAASALQAGRKLLQFDWRLRRLFVWHFSLAETVLAKQSLEEFAVDFLHKNKQLPVPRWSAAQGADGGLHYRRRRLHFFGQFEEIGRGCFKYYARCQHDPAHNQIALWVMHYRRDSDLQMLPAAIRPGSK